VGIARIMQCGWYKEVRVKDLDSHAIKALLVSRALLVKVKRDIENQVRGLHSPFRPVLILITWALCSAVVFQMAYDQNQIIAARDDQRSRPPPIRTLVCAQRTNFGRQSGRAPGEHAGDPRREDFFEIERLFK
jgi:hypothetical protein